MTDAIKLIKWATPKVLHSPLYNASNLIDGLWLKHEGELPGLTGTKRRKLIPIKRALADELDLRSAPGILRLPKNKTITLWSSPDSNFLLDFLLLIAPLGLHCDVYLTSHLKEYGNSTWLQFLKSDKVTLHEPPTDLKDYELKVQWAKVQCKRHKNCYRFGLGGVGLLSFLGSLSIALDILPQLHKVGCELLFTDAGTGLSLAGLLHGLNLLGINLPVVAVTHTPTPHDIVHTLNYTERLLKWMHKDYKLSMQPTLIPPAVSPSFGSINTRLMKDWQNITQSLGLLVDPIYSAKTILTAIPYLKNAGAPKTILILNGGSFGASGYHDYLRKRL